MQPYKTTECQFFSQNRCLKGDNCTFRHGLDDPKASNPIKFMRPIPHWDACVTIKNKEELELSKKLKIETWETYPRNFHYTIRGNITDCKEYFSKYIITEFPENPYFTRISNEGQNFIEVIRSTTAS